MTPPSWLLPALLLVSHAALAEPRVLVVPSSGETPYQGVVAGIRQAVADVPVDSQPLPPDRDALERMLREATPETVLVALGPRAAQAIGEANPALPAIACFVLNAAGLKNIPLWQTATLDLPPDIQANWIRVVLPLARTAGILYNPAESAAKAEALASALRRAGFTPRLAGAPHPGDIDAALEQLRGHADLLVSIPDLTVFNPIAAKTVMLFSYRHRVPVIGLAQSWAKAGALFSLEWDYEEHGRYCGQLALKAMGLGGRVQPPRKLLTSVNLRAAAYLHVVLPPGLVGMFTMAFD
jgi:putative tryptophan/tyrosine transport system substrate-binding protein